MVIGGTLMLKLLREVSSGLHPALEMAAWLTSRNSLSSGPARCQFISLRSSSASVTRPTVEPAALHDEEAIVAVHRPRPSGRPARPPSARSADQGQTPDPPTSVLAIGAATLPGFMPVRDNRRAGIRPHLGKELPVAVQGHGDAKSHPQL